MSAWYNENDPKAAAWLRELIKGGHIADGVVDERSIEDVLPNDLKDFTQCHFFAGIGGWSYALRLAGWPDERPVWTGSCPCQPFSAAGKGGGFADERHLWPAWHWLIKQCRPSIIFGEQVASKDGLNWFDAVSADLEDSGYTCAASDLCAAGIGAPHIRQRLYWLGERVDNPTGSRHCRAIKGTEAKARIETRLRVFGKGGTVGGLADTGSERRQQDTGSASSDEATDGRTGRKRSESNGNNEPSGHGADGGSSGAVVNATGEQVGLPGRSWESRGPGVAQGDANNERPQGRLKRWDSADQRAPWAASLVDCRDGKRRPVEPGTFPLAHGIPGRVGLLRGYGNAIVPQVAAAFIEAAMHI